MNEEIGIGTSSGFEHAQDARVRTNFPGILIRKHDFIRVRVSSLFFHPLWGFAVPKFWDSNGLEFEMANPLYSSCK